MYSALKNALNVLGDQNYQYGKGMPYLLLQTLISKAEKDRQFLQSMNLTGKTIYDVGAHVGVLTIFFAKKVGSDGTVVAFEPNPVSFSKLIINTAKYNNVKAFNMGLGNKHEKLTLVASAYSHGTGSVEPAMKREITKQRYKEWNIDVVPLDALPNLPPPHFVKIDVEGYERNVLEGMRDIILSYRPIVCMEIHGVNSTMRKRNLKKIMDILSGFDYRSFHIETHRRVNLTYLPSNGHILALPNALTKATGHFS